LSQVKRSRQPVVITQRGRAAAIVMSVEAYEESERERELLRRIAQGEREVKQGKGHELAEVLEEADRILEA
jgi:prevent-host-death family protein